jgi:beta-barrel assembly-enhancing protease
MVIMYALLGVGSLLTVTWVVVIAMRDEGQKTRDEMNKIADSAVHKGMGQAIDAATETPGKLMDNVSERSQRLADELGSTAQVVFGEMRDILRERKEQSPSDETQTKTSSTSPSDQPRRTRKEKNSAPVNLIGDLFRKGHEVAKSLDRIGQDALKLDAAEERQLGESLNQLICSEHRILNEPGISTRLATLATSFLNQRKRSDIDYTFVVIDDPEINAFAHAGGFVYVYTGLLEFVGDEGELRFVLGHEIAHVDLGHCVEQMTYATRASQGAGEFGGSLVQIAYQTIALGYSEDSEFEADAWAYAGLGDDQHCALRFLQQLAEKETQPQVEHGDKTALDDAVQEVENHFRTHPPTRERLMRLRQSNHDDQP